MIPQLFEPWLITESGLRLVFNVASRNAVFTEDRIRALEERAGKPLQNTRTVTVRDGVAIIPIAGPLMRHASMFTAISGATAYATIAKDFTTALEDSTVRAVLLYADSPGGEVNGCFELAAAIYSARGKGKKIRSLVEGTGASACYALASSCDEVECSPSSFLGSIGAVMAAVDRSKAEEMAGEKTIEFVSSVSPDKRPSLKTEEGRALYQARVDAIGDLFVDVVAKHRGRKSAYVIEHFGQGDVRIGEAAVACGLADGLSDFETSLAELAGPRNTTTIQMGAKMLTDQGTNPRASSSDDEDKEGDDEEMKAKKAKARADKAKVKKCKDDEESDAKAAIDFRKKALTLAGSTDADQCLALIKAGADAITAGRLAEEQAMADAKAKANTEARACIEGAVADGRLTHGKVASLADFLDSDESAAALRAAADTIVDAASLTAALVSVEFSAKDGKRIGAYLGSKGPALPSVHREPATDADGIAHAAISDADARKYGLDPARTRALINVNSVADLPRANKGA